MANSKKISTIKDIFKYVKFKPMMEDFTEVNPNSGISHRINGKDSNGKDAALTADDKKTITKGLEKLYSEAKEILK